jgi:hypothetical protein
MTRLINERKSLNDSLVYLQQMKDARLNNGANMDIHGKDSVAWARMLDSAKNDFDQNERIEARIPEITFSIDSLSKMK